MRGAAFITCASPGARSHGDYCSRQKDEYVEIKAARLGSDSEWRMSVVARMVDGLFKDCFRMQVP